MDMKARTLALAVLLGLCGTAAEAQKVHWSAYKSNLLNLQVSVPSDWKPVQIPKMLAFRYDDLAGGTAGMGILKSTQIGNIDEAADKELKTEGHPADWTHSPANVGGMRAIKITGTDVKDASRRFVHYYIETPNGVYIVQCQGSADRWNTFSPIFATILTKLTFF
jgi:hypothetical protein